MQHAERVLDWSFVQHTQALGLIPALQTRIWDIEFVQKGNLLGIRGVILFARLCSH